MRANAKLIVSLIKRIEVRLPINNNGRTIESLEQDPITQQTVAAIIELSVYKLPVIVNQLALVLESISKNIQPLAQTSTEPYIPFDVLQSQLFIIRLLSACLQHQWTWFKKQAQRISQETNITEEAVAAAAATGAYNDMSNSSDLSSSSNLSDKTPAPHHYSPKDDVQIDPPPLDEALVTFLLVLMSRFLSQMHILEERNEQNALLSSEHTNDGLAAASKVDPQTLEYIREIYNTSGKVLYYVSASNWPSYYAKIKNAINILGAVSESSDTNPPEVRILAFSCLNIPKLHTVLSDLSPYFLNMKIQGKLLFAKMMRMAIWKWMEMKPSQFAAICASSSRPLAGSEILFDMCNVAADNSRKKSVLWPLQTILLALTPDLLVQAFLDDRGLQNRRTGFPRLLKKALQASRTQEIAAICYVDLCKAATYISPNEDTILRHIAADVEDILREKVWDFSRTSAVDNLSSTLGYTISHQALVTDYFLARLCLDPKKTLSTLVPTLLEDDVPTVFKQAFVNSCLTIALEERTLPWNPTINLMYDSICAPLRRIFVQAVKVELSAGSSRSDISNTTSGSKKLNGSGEKKLLNVTALLQSMLKLFKLDPLCVLLGGTDSNNCVEENATIMISLINLMKHSDRRVRRSAADCLIQLHDSSFIAHWGPSITLINNFWKISSQTVLAIARQILDNRQNEDFLKSLLELLAKILISRNSFLRSILETAHENTDGHDRLQAGVTLEIALLVSLCSPIPDICSIATKCLGYMCIEAKMVDEDNMVDTASRVSQNIIGFNHNIEIYEDLSYEEPVSHGNRKQPFVGRKAQQKRVRKYLRMITTPTPGVLASWEEVWQRWKILTHTVSRFGMDSLRDLNEALNLPIASASSVKKIGGLVRHDKLRSSSVRTAVAPVPVGRIETDDEKQTEWQNYTGFLASLSGCRLAADMIDDDFYMEDKRSKGGDNRMGSPNRPIIIVEKFIMEMIELLTSENVVIREGVKDTLGGDLSPALYATLFRHLEINMASCFTTNGEVLCDNTNTLFVEQVVLVLKMILDRLTDPNDCLLSTDFSTLILQVANYINRLPHENYTTMRVMIMMCHLTEVLMLKKEQVIVRDDVRVRNKLLEIIVEWTSDFTLHVMNKTSIISSNPQNKEVQRDLDQVCLKAIVSLLDGLPLQSTETQTRDTDRSLIKSRLFQKYFAFFTQLLDRCHRYEAEATTVVRPSSSILIKSHRDLHNLSIKPSDSYQYWGPLKESAVNAISNLLNANVESGLKSSLAMGYHEDLRTRTAFIQVLANILNQGAQFDTLAENIITDRYDKLVEILVESDIEVALSLCDVCPAADAAGVATVLLACFESRGKILDFLKAIIDKEVHSTEQEATLFRGTNMATRALSIFARETCVDYIRFTLQPALEKINALPEDSLTWEMDPQKIGPNESISRNKQNVCRATELLLEAICNSIPIAPRLFRQELALIVDAVEKRFPDALKTSVGGFVFLRLFNPAILTPENSGFSKQALPKSKTVRKLLLQATRMMQNLANNMMFGAKETHLISLNDFITGNLYRVASFLREICVVPNFERETESKHDNRNPRMDNAGFMNLHRYMSDNLDKISRDLCVRRARSSTDTQKLLEWKRIMDKFSNLLAQLGAPCEIAQNELYTSRNYALVNSNNYYSEFMRRNKNRDVSSISSLNVFYQGGISRGGFPVFYFIPRNISDESFDFELLIYYMLRVMEPHLNHPFELLFDWTRGGAHCEIPVHWLNQFFQLVFTEMNDHLVYLHLFNPNFHLQRYIRKFPRILTNKLVKRTRSAISISELSNSIALSEIRLPKDSYDIEKEMGMTVTNAFLITSFKTHIPVSIKIGSEYFQVTTIRDQEIFWSLNTILNNVYNLNDLIDIFLPSVPANKRASGEGEIHITHDGGAATMILSVPNRDAVYKYLMDRKKTFDTHLTDRNHGIRPTDVPGRILNMALLNIGSDDPTLRLTAYNLLYSLCVSFRFGISHQLMNARDLCIPYNSVNFIVSTSEHLANSETHLTLEFLNECIVGFNRSSTETSRQIITLEYMVPWLKNLVFFTYSLNGKDASKVKDVIRSLITITAEKSEVYEHIQKNIWNTLKDIDELHNLVIDSLIQFSVESGIGSPQAEAIADTLVTMNCNAIRGKVINRMRRVLQSTSHNCKQTLIKHQSWHEIGCLVRFMLTISFYTEDIETPYVAEILHIISLVVSTGPTFIRSSVHELVVNFIHALVTNKNIRPENRKKLKYVLNDVCDGKYRVHFGLSKSYANAFTITEETMTDNVENMSLGSLEVIVRLLLDATNYAAPTIDAANTWHARWMSLVTSMTFRFNPALQPRAFVILGCLAQDEIDDDLLFQILIVLRNELARFKETDPYLIISIMMCLTNIIDNLSANSRYLKPMFWLAISMIQMNHNSIFSHAVKLLHAILRTLDAHKYFSNQSIESALMEARTPFASVSQEIDMAAGLSFNTQFSFAIAGVLLKGFKYSDARESIFMCLTTFLEIETKNGRPSNTIDAKCLGYLSGLLPFAAKNDALRELLRLAGIHDIDVDSFNSPTQLYATIWRAIEIPNNTTGILLVSFLVGMISLAENEAERLFLYGFLSRAAISTPEVFALVYDSLIPKMNSIVVSSDNVTLIEAVKNILITACSEPAFSTTEKSSHQRLYLDRIGFNALAEINFGSMNSSTAVNSKLISELLRLICE
ncbi:hypothetical protein INT47_001268 [Mucor saturninus]|uniref:Ras-GAP domain-containing protein n=1 Tax=Mucor saturninus TaxID=64648 RepID=A0A8H7VCR0_9FUNG|nr:hypothetical protein INT47_001268 [Mucor saturninus]